MATLLIASHTPGAGKTAVAAGLAKLIARRHSSVSLCKPLSPAGDADPDAAFYSSRFHSDIPVSGVGDAAALDAAANAVSALSDANEHTLLEVANPVSGSGISSPLTTGLSERLSARVIALFAHDAELSAATISAAVSDLGDRLAGVIINQTPRYRVAKAASILAEIAAAGVPTLGALPEDRPMLSLTMTQLANSLGGRWELEPSDAEAWIDRFLIGGNIMDSGAGYFGRYPRQAVITRAERPDIQMASLVPNTLCLVLTGGARPTEYIRVEATKRNIPVLLVDVGTVAAADAIGNLLDAAVPHHDHKAERMADLLAERIDISPLLY